MLNGKLMVELSMEKKELLLELSIQWHCSSKCNRLHM
ncbi:hypothetical protein A2U01_0097839, partial [Trifolium medium]|nr:hypothetical protein [Trifolium medium]